MEVDFDKGREIRSVAAILDLGLIERLAWAILKRKAQKDNWEIVWRKPELTELKRLPTRT